MKKIKSSLRLLALVCLIILAVFGVGIAGGVPVYPSNKRENNIEVRIELIESEEDETDLVQFDFQQ
ncbi:MAG: hypothetical protein R3E32_18335 [Chitinophagales bacterium]